MHYPYEKALKHKADFRLKYKFINYENGGRKHLPFQGIRFDFSYEDDTDDKIYMIFPEFEDENGNIILENDKPVLAEGTALMWIIVPERRIIHRDKIKTGIKCFFGKVKIANCEVIEVLDLFKNPVHSALPPKEKP